MLMGIIFIRTLIIFLTLIILMRLLGKRQLRELELSELVVSVLLADMAATPLQDTSIPLINGIIPITTLFACELVISGVMMKSLGFRNLMCGKPAFLIIHGEIQEAEMRKSRLSIDELFEELRSKEILDPRTVQYAVLETDGTLNTILEPRERPLSAANAGLSPSDCGYPRVIISDGAVIKNNLDAIGKKYKWMESEIKKCGANDPKEIFIMIYFEDGNIYIQKKER